MRQIVIDMQSILFSDAVEQALRGFDSDFDIYRSEKPEETANLCCMVHPFALLLEVTGYKPWQYEERMKIRDEVKEKLPDCKIVFIVDENTERKLADRVRQAKKDGVIDQFIYESVSASYLAALIDSI